jgi:hypothetical protein
MFTEADLQLIEADFTPLAELCAHVGMDESEVEEMIVTGRLPQPAYTLPGGRRMVPDDYFRLYNEVGSADNLRAHFIDQFERAADEAGLHFTDDWNPVSYTSRERYITQIERRYPEAFQPNDD